MTFSGINWWSIVISVVLTFAASGIWFGPKTFYPVWQKALGSGPENQATTNPGIIFGRIIAGVTIEILVLGWILNTIQAKYSNIGLLDGAIIGFWLGLGILALPSLSHRQFAKNGVKVWLIENSIDVIMLTVSGAIIAGMR
jgi:hypothetical protein